MAAAPTQVEAEGTMEAAAILDEARKKKIARVALRVEKTNVAAVSLYESLGFREDLSRATAHEGYYGAGRHGAVYEYFP